MEKLKYIKIEHEDGTLSENVPIGADASNIDVSASKTLNTKLSEIDGSLLQTSSQAEQAIAQAEQAIAKANAASNSVLNLQSQVDNIITSAGTEGSSSSEIIAARTSTEGYNYPTLGARITTLERKVGSRMSYSGDVDFNTYLTPGKYVVTSLAPEHHGPAVCSPSGILVVEGCNSIDKWENTTEGNFQWLIQTYYGLHKQYPRSPIFRVIVTNLSSGTIYYPWFVGKYEDYIDNAFTRKDFHHLAYETYGQISQLNITNLDDVHDAGIYIVDRATTNSPTTGILIVETYDPSHKYDSAHNTSSGWVWVAQTVMDEANGGNTYKRLIRYKLATGELFAADVEWYNINNEKIVFPEYNELWGLRDKKIVNFGDSIFGNQRGINSISYWIGQYTGATVYNQGYGGCQMGDRGGTTWNAFSFCHLVDAIVDNDFTWQDEVLANLPSGMPTYFREAIAELKTLNFSEIDYITVGFGTNDYTAGKQLDNENNAYDKTTLFGALRYSLKKLLNAYPNLRVLIGTPTWRCWFTNGEVTSTSDTVTYTPGYTLKECAEQFKEICKGLHFPCIDMYNDLGLNEYTWPRFFNGTDGTHPTALANRELARHWACKIVEL